MLAAVLFDLDGTLIDTNEMHVRAWHAALQAHGYNVAADRLAVEIGKGGDQLVPDVLGEEAEAKDGDALREAHDACFAKLAAQEGILAMPGAKELLAALRAKGLKLALATSSGKAQLARMEQASGVEWRALVDATTDADDVKRSKPHPDIVAKAAEKLGVSPAACAMFGDTPWDAKSAVHAGVVLVGLTCGGSEPAALLRAGARAVYRDPADVLASLDEVLHRASPGRARLDQPRLDALMGHALGAARDALAKGEAPIGCAIATGDGELIATGFNRFVATGDRVAHAEIAALHAAGARLPERDAILVSTLEPCVMCLGAAMEVAIDTVVYAAPAPADCGTSRVTPPESPDSQMPRIVGGVRRDEAKQLFEDWLAKPHDRRQEPYIKSLLKLIALLAVILVAPRPAAAWTIGSQLDYTGCHEKITEQAFRAVRGHVTTAPPIDPTRDERALIDEVQFVPPDDFRGDLAGMSLLLGLRDNDLKGNNPLDTLQLVQVHGNPDTQQEHCIRRIEDDNEPGNQSALDACRAFIHQRFMEAIAALDEHGVVDPDQRMELAVYVTFAGRIYPKLPTFYVKLGQAVHALEDGFTHTYRSPDGVHVTVVQNWIEYVSNAGPVESRDGPGHLAGLDDCEGSDPLVARNFTNAVSAATDLIDLALDPSRDAQARLAAVDALTEKWLTYQPGCTLDNAYCDAAEPKVTTSGCNAGGGSLGAALALLLLLRRKRFALLFVSSIASAQPDPTPAPDPATAPTADQPKEAPAVPTTSDGKEPGRDVKTPTVEQLEKVREDKQLGSEFGFAAMLGGSFDHGSLVGQLGVRYRLSERWTIGIDGEWNPWIGTAPLTMKGGAGSVMATVIRRWPMKFDHVNLRTTLSAGASMLLFDVYGAPKYDIGPYGALSPLGIDYDLGGSVRIVFDPLCVAVPVPHVGLIPLYYEEFRTMIGIQIGG